MLLLIFLCIKSVEDSEFKSIIKINPSPHFIAFFMSKKYGDTYLTRNNYSSSCIMRSTDFLTYISSDEFLSSRYEIEHFKPYLVYPFDFFDHKFILLNNILIPKSALKIIILNIINLSNKLKNNSSDMNKILKMTQLGRNKIVCDDIRRNCCIKNFFIGFLKNKLDFLIKICPDIFYLDQLNKKSKKEYNNFIDYLYNSFVYDYKENFNIISEWSQIFNFNEEYQINLIIDNKRITLLLKDIVTNVLVHSLLSE